MTVRNQTVNARAETIFENASFRVPIRQRRCLVPVSGFYGWRHEQHRKIPLYVTLKERPLFSLAGIFDRWYCRATAAWTTTFSIITTEANPLMRYVNNANGRMPVILRSDDEPLAQSRAVRCADRRTAQALSGAGAAQRTRAVRLHARSRCRSAYSYPLRRAQQKREVRDFPFLCRGCRVILSP